VLTMDQGVTTTRCKKLLDKCKTYNNKFKKFSPKDITAYTFELPALHSLQILKGL